MVWEKDGKRFVDFQGFVARRSNSFSVRLTNCPPTKKNFIHPQTTALSGTAAPFFRYYWICWWKKQQKPFTPTKRSEPFKKKTSHQKPNGTCEVTTKPKPAAATVPPNKVGISIPGRTEGSKNAHRPAGNWLTGWCRPFFLDGQVNQTKWGKKTTQPFWDFATPGCLEND